MKKILGLGAVALAAVMLAACATQPKPPPPPPQISGFGEFTYEVRVGDENGPVALEGEMSHGVGGASVEFALNRSGSIYTGPVIAHDPSDPMGELNQCYTLQTTGRAITAAVGRDCANPPGVGGELTDDSPEVTTTTESAVCPGQNALVIRIAGTTTENGVPSGLHIVINYTVCDPVAAAWFV